MECYSLFQLNWKEVKFISGSFSFVFSLSFKVKPLCYLLSFFFVILDRVSSFVFTFLFLLFLFLEFYHFQIVTSFNQVGDPTFCIIFLLKFDSNLFPLSFSTNRITRMASPHFDFVYISSFLRRIFSLFTWLLDWTLLLSWEPTGLPCWKFFSKFSCFAVVYRDVSV